MNTIQALKKCIQIDYFEYTLFLNTLIRYHNLYLSDLIFPLYYPFV